MIGPSLGAPVAGPPHATMLVYLFTDVAADVAELNAALAAAVEPSFNSISIDGDTSTNDTVLLVASGASGVKLSKELDSRVRRGARRRLPIAGAPDHRRRRRRHPRRHARHSRRGERGRCRSASQDHRQQPAVQDRLVERRSELGPSAGCRRAQRRRLRAGANAASGSAPSRSSSTACARPPSTKLAAHAAMMQPEYTITIDLGEGDGTCRFLTCDLTVEYVHINADYST